MSNNNTPKIPESVIESLARATLSAMRRAGVKPKSSERSDDGKAQTHSAQRGNKTEKGGSVTVISRLQTSISTSLKKPQIFSVIC